MLLSEHWLDFVPPNLIDEEDHAAKMDGELGDHGEDGVHVENVGQRPLPRQGCQRLGP